MGNTPSSFAELDEFLSSPRETRVKKPSKAPPQFGIPAFGADQIHPAVKPEPLQPTPKPAQQAQPPQGKVPRSFDELDAFLNSRPKVPHPEQTKEFQEAHPTDVWGATKHVAENSVFPKEAWKVLEKTAPGTLAAKGIETALRKAGHGWEADLVQDVSDVGSESVRQMASPENIALLLSGSMTEKLPLLAAASSGYFSATQLYGAYEQFMQAAEMYKNGTDSREARKQALGAAVSVLFGGLAGYHGLKTVHGIATGKTPALGYKGKPTEEKPPAETPQAAPTAEPLDQPPGVPAPRGFDLLGEAAKQSLPDERVAQRIKEGQLHDKIRQEEALSKSDLGRPSREAELKEQEEASYKGITAETERIRKEAGIPPPAPFEPEPIEKRGFEEPGQMLEPAEIIAGRQPRSPEEREQMRVDERTREIRAEIDSEKRRRADMARKALDATREAEEQTGDLAGKGFRTIDRGKVLEPPPSPLGPPTAAGEGKPSEPGPEAPKPGEKPPGEPLPGHLEAPPDIQDIPSPRKLEKTEQALVEALVDADRQRAAAQDPDRQAKIDDEIAENKQLLKDVRADAQAARTIAGEKQELYDSGPQVEGIDGSEGVLDLVTGKHRYRNRLVRSSKLKPSHDPHTFKPIPGYPKNVQDRDYENDKDAQYTAMNRAKDENFQQGYILSRAPGSGDGFPVTVPNGVVPGGNSRVIILNRLSEAKRIAFLEALKNEAHFYGFKEDDIDRELENPNHRDPLIPVRELIDPPRTLRELQALGTDLNRPQTRALGPLELAVAAGKRISQGTMSFVASQLSNMGDEQSLRDVLRDKGPRITEMMVADGVISPTEMTKYIDEKTGSLNDDGKDYFENALLGAVIDDASLLKQVPRGTMAKVERALAPLATTKALPNWDITDYLKDALKDHIKVMNSDLYRDVKDLYREPTQGNLMAGGEELIKRPKWTPPHPIREALGLLLNESGKTVKEKFEDYAHDIVPTIDRNVDARTSFNEHFKAKVREDEWGTLRPHPTTGAPEEPESVPIVTPPDLKPPEEEKAANVFTNKEDGTEVRVTKLKDGRFSVTMHDVDSGNTLPHARIYKTEAEALAKAREISSGKEATAPPKDLSTPQRDRVAAEFKKAFKDATPEQIEWLMKVVDTRAKAAGLSTDEWITRRGLSAKTTQESGKRAGGGQTAAKVNFIGDFQAIITAYSKNNPTFAELVHETIHVFEKDLSPEERQAARKAFGVKGEKWTIGEREQFAVTMEKWFADGKAPTPELQGIFTKFKNWLTDIYKSLKESGRVTPIAPGKKGNVLDIKVSPEMDRLFAKILGVKPEEMERPPEPGPVPPPVSEPAPGPVLGEEKSAEPDQSLVYPKSEADTALSRLKKRGLAPPGEAKPKTERKAKPSAGPLELTKKDGVTQWEPGKYRVKVDIPNLNDRPTYLKPGIYDVEVPKKRTESVRFVDPETGSGTQELPGMLEAFEKQGRIQFSDAKAGGPDKPPSVTLSSYSEEDESINDLSTYMGHLFENGHRDFDSNSLKVLKEVGDWAKPYMQVAWNKMLSEGKAKAQKALRQVLSDEQRRKYVDQLGMFERHEAKNRRIELPPGAEDPRGQRPDDVRAKPDASNEPQGRSPTGQPAGSPDKPLGSEPLGTSGGGVSGAGKGSGPARVTNVPAKPLRNVPAPKIDVDFIPSASPVIELAEWKQRLEDAGLPSELPPPTVSLTPSIEDKLILKGQPEATMAAMTALDKYDAVVMATSTGTGKMYMGSAILAERKPQFGLVLSPNDPVANQWIEVAKGFGVDIKRLPQGAMPSEPGIYVGTYGTAANRKGVDTFKWDMAIADESHNARGWHGGKGGTKAGRLVKAMAPNAQKMIYMSATPYQSALEMGYMDKLGLWRKQGIEKWLGGEFSIYKDSKGNWSGGVYNPRKLAALREELVRRGMQINLDRDMEGVKVHFSKVPLSPQERLVQKNIVQGFALVEQYFLRKGLSNMIMATKGNAVTFMKSYLERLKLPSTIEVAKKAEAAGWKNTFFTQTKSKVDEIYDFMKPADDFFGGEVSRLIPRLPGVVEVLKEAFGDDLANFTGPHGVGRQEEIDAFNRGEKKHVVATFGAGGVGIGMHDVKGDAPRAVFYVGLPWSGVVMDQSLGRHARGGARSDILIHIPVTDSKAEVQLMARKIMPRLASMRAAISGIDKEDPILEGMGEAHADIDAIIDYGTFGGQHKPTMDELVDADDAKGLKNFKEVPIPDAEQAKNKPMRGERKKKPPTVTLRSEMSDVPQNLPDPDSIKARNAAEATRTVRRPYVPGGADKKITDPRLLDILNKINKARLGIEPEMAKARGTAAPPTPPPPLSGHPPGLPPDGPNEPPKPPEDVIGERRIPMPGSATPPQLDMFSAKIMRNITLGIEERWGEVQGIKKEWLDGMAHVERGVRSFFGHRLSAPYVLSNHAQGAIFPRLYQRAEMLLQRKVANFSYEANQILGKIPKDEESSRRVYEALHTSQNPERDLVGAVSKLTTSKKPFTSVELHAAQRLRDEIFQPIIELVRAVRPDVGWLSKYAPLMRQINELAGTYWPELQGQIPADLAIGFPLEVSQMLTKDPTAPFIHKRTGKPPTTLRIEDALQAYIPSMLRVAEYTPLAKRATVMLNRIPDRLKDGEKSRLKEYAVKYSHNFFGVADQFRELTKDSDWLARKMVRRVYSATLDFNPNFLAMHSAKVPINVWPELGKGGMKYAMKGYAGMLSPDGQELVARSGVLQDAMWSIDKPATTVGRKWAAVLKYGVALSDRIDRGVAYLGGLEKAKDLGLFERNGRALSAEEVGKLTWTRLNELTSQGVDISNALDFAYGIAARSNFMYTPANVHFWQRAHPVLGMYQTFAAKEYEFFANAHKLAKEAKAQSGQSEAFIAEKLAKGEYQYVDAQAKYRRLIFTILASGVVGSRAFPFHSLLNFMSPPVIYGVDTLRMLHKLQQGTLTQKEFNSWLTRGAELYVRGGGSLIHYLTAKDKTPESAYPEGPPPMEAPPAPPAP